jgi:hypothetical protein
VQLLVVHFIDKHNGDSTFIDLLMVKSTPVHNVRKDFQDQQWDGSLTLFLGSRSLTAIRLNVICHLLVINKLYEVLERVLDGFDKELRWWRKKFWRAASFDDSLVSLNIELCLFICAMPRESFEFHLFNKHRYFHDNCPSPDIVSYNTYTYKQFAVVLFWPFGCHSHTCALVVGECLGYGGGTLPFSFFIASTSALYLIQTSFVIE